MIIKKINLLLALLLFTGHTTILLSQNPTEASYDLEFIKGEFTKKRKNTEIILYFKYEKEEDDKTLISAKITYNIGDNNGDVVEILNQSNHSIVFYGTTNIKEKNPELYNLLKDKIDFDIDKELFILAFHLRNITKKYIDKMTFKYGLWEPSNSEIRFETEFDIVIEDKSRS